jgi:hypothetical protein
MCYCARIDWGPIRQIHRADDSWICFCRKGAELLDGTQSWLELGGIRADELETMFPQVVRSLFEDSFFSINGMFKAERPEFETLRCCGGSQQVPSSVLHLLFGQQSRLGEQHSP